MSYDHDIIFGQINRRLTQEPRTTLGSLARQLRIDRHTLQMVVLDRTSMRFRDFQKLATLHRALVLLWQPDPLSVKEVAYLLGYRSPDAFSRFFREMSGIRPTETRHCVGDTSRCPLRLTRIASANCPRRTPGCPPPTDVRPAIAFE
jgi:AraC-like DNA-binding protein